jgi:hypothetical protein
MRTLLLLACGLLATPSFGFQLRRDSQGDVVRWPAPVRFVVDAQLAQVLGVERAEAAVEAALAEVGTAAPKVALKLERGGATSELGYHRDDGAWGNVVVALEQWPFEKGNVAATIVTVDARANEILDADIVFNAEEYDFTVLDRPQPSARVHDVQTVFTHELGHALGLQHEAAVPEAVMYPAATPGQFAKRALSNDDRAGVQALYGGDWTPPVETPAEAAAGCSAAPGGGLLEALLPALALLGLRRRARTAGPGPRRGGSLAAAVAVALLAAPALASEPALGTRVGPEVERAALGEVVFTRSYWVDARRRLMATEVEVRVDGCVKGVCAERTVRLLRPGGRIGDLEQSITHQPVLDVGDAVLLTWTQGRVRLAGQVKRVYALPGR